MDCESCARGLEHYCEHVPTLTHNNPDRISGENTYGGYSDSIVVREEFVLNVRHREKDLAGVAPLLCAGVAMWSPLRHWKVSKGQKVGIVGMGGLGHIGLKFAEALGAHVVAFTTSKSKREDALKLGADEVVVSHDANAMAAHANSFEFILDTVAVPHNLDAYLALLKRDATLTLVGIPAQPHPAPALANIVLGRRALGGSALGGINETQARL